MTTTRTYAGQRLALATHVADHGTYPIVAILLGDGYVFNEDHEHIDDLTDEITTGSVARITLTTPTAIDDVIDSADVNFGSVTFTDALTLVFAADQGADAVSPLLWAVDFGSPLSVTAEPFVVAPPAGGWVNAITVTPASTGGASNASDLTVDTGTMPGLEGSPYAPADDKLDAYLGGIDDTLGYALGQLATLGADLDDAVSDNLGTAGVGVVLATQGTYLKVGHDGTGSPTHDEGAFVCDTDLEFTTGLDVRVWGRVVNAGSTGTFAEWVTRNVDALVGSVDGYELAVYHDDDGFLRWFSEHIYTGQTVEQDPKPITTAGAAGNPGFGTLHGIRHTMSFTGGAGGNGVETFWVATTGAPDDVTADGNGWKAIFSLAHDHPESIKTYTEPWHIGLSQHESHIFVVQMFDGIDGTCLVDLHAADATSATSVTCRQGTVWTAAGSQGEIVGYQTTGGGSVATDTIWNAAGDLAYGTGSDTATRLALGTTGHVLKAGASAPEWGTLTAADVAAETWHSSIDVFSPVSASNSHAPVAAAGYLTGGYQRISSADAQWAEWPTDLSAGDWTLKLFHIKESGGGIMRASIDGTSIGTVDTYAVSLTGNNISTVTFTVATGGKKVLRVACDGKNASSSAYNTYLQKLILTRTA